MKCGVSLDVARNNTLIGLAFVLHFVKNIEHTYVIIINAVSNSQCVTVYRTVSFHTLWFHDFSQSNFLIGMTVTKLYLHIQVLCGVWV